VTVLANGTTYINSADEAARFLDKLADHIGSQIQRVDEPAQRAAVMEAELRVRQALAAGDPEGPAAPTLVIAIRALRMLNKAVNEAKHDGEVVPVKSGEAASSTPQECGCEATPGCAARTPVQQPRRVLRANPSDASTVASEGDTPVPNQGENDVVTSQKDTEVGVNKEGVANTALTSDGVQEVVHEVEEVEKVEGKESVGSELTYSALTIGGKENTASEKGEWHVVDGRRCWVSESEIQAAMLQIEEKQQLAQRAEAETATETARLVAVRQKANKAGAAAEDNPFAGCADTDEIWSLAEKLECYAKIVARELMRRRRMQEEDAPDGP